LGSPWHGQDPFAAAVCAAAGEGGRLFSLEPLLALPPDALAGSSARPVLCVASADAVAADPLVEKALFRLFNERGTAHPLIFRRPYRRARLAWGCFDDWALAARPGPAVVYQLARTRTDEDASRR